jgi:hypothetical protein
VALGRPIATFLLGRPYAEEIAPLRPRWAATDGIALLWTGTPMALGVFFHPDVPAARRALSHLSEGDRLRDLTTITVDLTEARIPVYFDFEGAWARIAGIPTSAEYPFGLGFGAGRHLEGPRRPLPDRLRRSASELLEQPFHAAAPGLLRWLGLGSLDRRQRELVESGYVRPRTLLEPSAVPENRGRCVDQIVLVTGEMRDRSDPISVLSDLRSQHGTSPFLFASEGSRVLVGLLGHAGRGPSTTGPDPTASAPLGPLLRDTLARRMHRVDVYREEAAAIRAPIDHQYGSLLRPSPPPPVAASRTRARGRAPE